MKNWRNLRYLLDGTQRQREAYRALRFAGVERILADFDPILVGTIPLDIDVEGSDLDIALNIPDQFQYAQVLYPHFSQYPNFRYRHKTYGDESAWIVNFEAHDFEFELFAQRKPSDEQNAYKHMVVEHRLLQIGGSEARHAIREMKYEGLKTEPAFATYFEVAGDDPYDALLALYDMDDEALHHYLMDKEVC